MEYVSITEQLIRHSNSVPCDSCGILITNGEPFYFATASNSKQGMPICEGCGESTTVEFEAMMGERFC